MQRAKGGVRALMDVTWTFEDVEGHEEVTAVIKSEGDADAYVTQWRDAVAITVDFARADTLAVISGLIRRFRETGKIWVEGAR